MPSRIADELKLFQHPEWLWAIAFALIPLMIVRLRPRRYTARASGWNAPSISRRDHRRYLYFIRKAIIAAVLCLFALAFARPARPILTALKPTLKGHHWAVIIDCSGSMSQIDASQNLSRLQQLAQALENAIAQRPHDRFSLIRVAGYADRIGPSTTDKQFLTRQLRQISPALPGEDGTSLGDSLILAADILSRTGQIAGSDNDFNGQSILLISDGRDNPPDPHSEPLENATKLIAELNITFDWMRLELPSDPAEPELSDTRAKQAESELKKLAEATGGSIFNITQNTDWNQITNTTLRNYTNENDLNHWPTFSILIFIIIATLYFLLLLIESYQFYLSDRLINLANLNRILIPVLGCAFIISFLMTHFSRVDTPQNESQSLLTAERAIVIAIDVSPSMAAQDTAQGTRLKTAQEITHGIIGQCALSNEIAVKLVIFSGRALQISPLTTDWKSLSEIIDHLELRQVRPDGSDWNELFELLLSEVRQQSELIKESGLRPEIIIVTDGEASAEPTPEQLGQIQNSRIKISTVTLGNNDAPGMVFSADPQNQQLWLVPNSNQPARSHRVDTLAEKVSTQTSGVFAPVGSSDFNSVELTQSLLGNIPLNALTKSSFNQSASGLAYAAFLLVLINEIIELIKLCRIRRITHFIVITLIVPAQGCHDDRNAIDRHMMIAIAKDYRTNGDLIRAESVLQLALAKNRSDAVLHYNLGLIAIDKRDFESALQSFSTAIAELKNADANQHNNRVLLMRSEAGRGYALASLKRWPEAHLALIQSQNAVQPGDPFTQNEWNEIQINLDYVQRMIARSDKNGDTKNTTPVNNPSASNSNQSGADATDIRHELQERAEAARNRSRTARSIFDQAGDTIVGPLPALNKQRRMNW